MIFMKQDAQSIASENWREQRRNKTKIEDQIAETISGGDMMKTALDFVAHLRKNNFGIVWSAANEWWVTLYCRAICKICLRDDGWDDDSRLTKYSWTVGLRLNFTDEYQDSITNDDAQNRVLTYDPDDAAIKNIKELLHLEKKAVIAEQKKGPSLYRRQKDAKPLIEDVIPEYLDDQMKKTALDFSAWLRENKLTPGWTLSNTWNSRYKGKTIYTVVLGEEVWNNSKFWFVSLNLIHLDEYEESIVSAGLQKIVWDNIKYCESCTGCAPGRDATLFGKCCAGLCYKPDITVCDPDGKTIDGVKKLLEFEKSARDENAKTVRK